MMYNTTTTYNSRKETALPLPNDKKQFTVPSWQTAPTHHMKAGDNPTTTADTNKKQFTVPSWQTAPTHHMKAGDNPTTTAAYSAQRGGVMAKIEALEQAKHRAAASFARMMSAGPATQATQETTTRDELDVLTARVDVLNTLMRNPDARLCLESSSGVGARACVTYDRMRCEGELELGPMQSTMAWAVRGGEDPVLNLLSAGDNAAGHAAVVRGLLGLIRESAPKKDVLRGLHELLATPPPERLVLKSVSGLNSTREDHTRVVEGLGEAVGEAALPPLYRITWGALDLDILEGWQNPSTNTAIRLSILDAAHQAVREAERTKAPAWSNVSYLQARIFHNDECHVLSLRPFWDSESCTVSHLQFKQSVFDDSGPERGLLNLSQDARAVHAIPMGKILPIQAYVCLGAHRKSRLNEAQLNYVHAQGLLAHGFDVKLLPEADTLLSTGGDRMIAAKSTRISADKLDIMASSYHVADQVYTSISVVQYPPFGTQFEKVAKVTTSASTPNKSFPTSKPLTQGKNLLAPMPKLTNIGSDTPPAEDDLYSPRSESHQSSKKSSSYKSSHWGSQATSEDGTYSDDDDQDGDDVNFGAAFKIRERKESENATPKYKEVRVDHTPQENVSNEKYLAWGVKMRHGEHFFVDGVLGDPFDINKRFIWFEIDNGKRYKAAEHLATQIRDYLKFNHRGMWHTDKSFYWNIHNNTNRGADGRIPREVWTFQWTSFIRDQIKKHNEKYFNEIMFFPENVRSFWYTHDESQWDHILDATISQGTASVSSIYKRRAQETFMHYKTHGFVQSKMTQRTPRLQQQSNAAQVCFDTRLTIPMPQTQLSARAGTKSILRQEANPATLHQLQNRIDALETRLSRVHQEENTKHLLEQVLDKLDSLETETV